MKQDIDSVSYHYYILVENIFNHLGDCLRLLTVDNTSYNAPVVKSTIDDHLARFELLSNRTASLNKYVSTSISMMIAQVRGIIYYQSNSFQECLNVLNDATQREFNLVSDYNSPALIFARSSELLAVHLLLINTLFRSPSVNLNLCFSKTSSR